MKFVQYSHKSFRNTPYYNNMPLTLREEFDVLTQLLHFKTNNYVLDKLIDWEHLQDDPMYRLCFPRKDMLFDEDYKHLKHLLTSELSEQDKKTAIDKMKRRLWPNMNVQPELIPRLNGIPIPGLYHPFPTILNVFPSPAVKTCHAYCSYCFRWVQFVDPDLQRNTAYSDPNVPVEYLRSNPAITDVLITGSDPLTVKAEMLKRYIDPLLDVESVKVIRISTKSLAWWPYRFTSDIDSDELLGLFKYVQSRGKHMTLIAHFTHPAELETIVVKEAITRIQSTGTVIRCQGPLVKGINDSAKVWEKMWNKQVSMGMHPYYMFMEADHDPKGAFRLPLAESLHIFKQAYRNITGLARVVRGPVFMNNTYRVLLDGIIEVGLKKYFALKCIQSPNSEAEGEIKLIPYDDHLVKIENLGELFSKKRTVSVSSSTIIPVNIE